MPELTDAALRPFLCDLASEQIANILMPNVGILMPLLSTTNASNSATNHNKSFVFNVSSDGCKIALAFVPLAQAGRAIRRFLTTYRASLKTKPNSKHRG